MPQFAAALQAEIRRLARKEVKALTSVTKKAAAQHRRDIAALKRHAHMQERKIALLEALERKRSALLPAPATVADGKRFSARWLKAHRARLKLSAEDYGKLAGISSLSVYSLERGKTKPRKATLAALVAVRGMGRREALRRLEMRNGK